MLRGMKEEKCILMADMSNKEEEEGELHLMIPTDIPTHKQTKTVMPHSVEKVLSIYQVVFEEPKVFLKEQLTMPYPAGTKPKHLIPSLLCIPLKRQAF